MRGFRGGELRPSGFTTFCFVVHVRLCFGSASLCFPPFRSCAANSFLVCAAGFSHSIFTEWSKMMWMGRVVNLSSSGITFAGSVSTFSLVTTWTSSIDMSANEWGTPARKD